jgi:hypothetical protein
MHAGAHQLVDRQLDGGQVGRHQRHALAVAQLRQAGSELRAVAGVEPVGDFRDVLVPEVPCRLRDLSFDQVEKGRVIARQDVGEAEVAAAPWSPSLRRRADLGHHLQHTLHRVGVHAGSLVQHPIDRGGAHTRTCGDVGNGGGGRHGMRGSEAASLVTSLNKSIRVSMDASHSIREPA